MKKFNLTKSVLACSVTAVLSSFGLQAAEPVDNMKPTKAVQVVEGLKTQFIVTFKEGVAPDMSTKASQSAVASLTREMSTTLGQDVKHLRSMAVANSHVFKLNEKLDEKQIASVIKSLMKNPKVDVVEEDRILTHMTADSRYNDQWHYFESTGGLNAVPAWGKATGAGVTVAVLDTGYVYHSDLDANMLPGYDMISDTSVSNDGNGRDNNAADPGDWTTGQCGPSSSSSWHGTHVAGTIAAVTNNNKGVAGVAYGSKVVPVRVLGTCGGYTSDIADGIIWASGGSVSGVPANANPAKVINMGLGGSGSCSSVTQSAINTARSNGSVVVVAAGNSNANVSGFNPANCNGVVSVAATDRNGGRAAYSNYGSLIDVAAPGGRTTFANDPNGVLSTLNSGSQGPASENYEFYQGTSMAAPHVAGVAAMIFEKWPSATPDQVEDILKNTARSQSCGNCGTGIVDANAAVDAAIAQDTGSGGGGGTPPSTGYDVGGQLDNLSVARGAWLRYTWATPATSLLELTISGGTGDADLYVKLGSAPQTNSYDCRPYLTGNNEKCTFTNSAAGTWNIGIRGYSAASGFSLIYGYNN